MKTTRQSLMQRVADLPEELLAEVDESVADILAWHDGLYRMSDDERAAVRKGLDAARRGEFASDDEMAEYRRRQAG